MKVNINNAGTRYTLLEDCVFPLWNITVPTNFITDLATIPKFLWSVYPPAGYYQHAAILHDYLYTLHHMGEDACDRKEADRRFRVQMKADGVGIRTCWTFWLAVRLFGGIYWNRKASF